MLETPIITRTYINGWMQQLLGTMISSDYAR
jgi:hypothetical protein